MFRTPNLVYAGSGHEVVTMMVVGAVLVRDCEALVANADGIRVKGAIRAEAQVQAE